jgi:hypothetical protein
MRVRCSVMLYISYSEDTIFLIVAMIDSHSAVVFPTALE